MNEILIYKMVNGNWKYVTRTLFYNRAKEICEELNRYGYNAKVTKPHGTTIKYYILE